MKKAAVTGASSGIGRDIARELAGRGYALILIARREERLRSLAEELPVPVEVLPADLSRRETCLEVAGRLRKEGLDVLVNDAGRGLFGAFDETDLEGELALLDLNITALHILMKAVLPGMKARGSGHILNVASSAAFLPGPLLSSYYASKAYVLRLSMAVAEELRRSGSGVKISVLCPGPVDTEFDQVARVRFSRPACGRLWRGEDVGGEAHRHPGALFPPRPCGPPPGAGAAPGPLLLARPAPETGDMTKRRPGSGPLSAMAMDERRDQRSSRSSPSNWTPSRIGVPAARVREMAFWTKSTARAVASASVSSRSRPPNRTEAKRSPVPEKAPSSRADMAKWTLPVRRSKQPAPTVPGVKLTPVMTTERAPSRERRRSHWSTPA